MPEGFAAMYKKLNAIKKITRIFNRVKRRLPSTYPQPSLVLHMSEEELRKYYYDCTDGGTGYEGYPAYDPYAFCDGSCTTVHMPVDMNESAKGIARVILHEIGHLYALQRYGESDPRWSIPGVAEPYADRFAARWLRRLVGEGWF